MVSRQPLGSGDVARIVVRVVPRSGRTEVAELVDGIVRIRLKSPPVDGAANKELCDFIAKSCRVPKSQVTILSGRQSRNKTVQIAGHSNRSALAVLLERD